LILAAALTPAFADAISVDEGNLQQIALAMRNHDSSFGHLPAAFIDSGGTPLLSWRVAILPFLGPQASALYSAFDLTKPWNDPANLPLLQQMPDVYRSPLDPAGTTVTRYAVGTGPNTMFPGANGVTIGSVVDGISNTILAGETEGSNIPWTEPIDIPIGASPTLGGSGFSSFIAGGVPFVFVDGSVHILPDNIDSATLHALFTRNGNEPVTVPEFTPAPEAGSALLLMFGLAGLCVSSHRETGRDGNGRDPKRKMLPWRPADTAMNGKNLLSVAVAVAGMAMAAGSAAAQTHPDSLHVAQPHLKSALALAAQENSWRHPGARQSTKIPAAIRSSTICSGGGRQVHPPQHEDRRAGPGAAEDPDHGARPRRPLRRLRLPGGKISCARVPLGGRLGPGRKDRQGAGLRPGMPARRDRILKDGDTITLGDASIRIYLTPGHSSGSTAMLIPVKDKGKARLLAYFGGIENPLMLPETGRSYDAFDQSFARMSTIIEAARVDGYLAAHSNYDDAPFKIEVRRHNPPTLPNPFLIGTARVVLFTRISRECNRNNADIHRAMPDLKPY
jgi:hypothetical protein